MANTGDVGLLCELLPDERVDSDMLSYLATINDSGVEFLRSEMSRLRDDSAHISQQTQAMTFDNYKTFVDISACSSDVLKNLEGVCERLETVCGSSIPHVMSLCREFSTAGGHIQQQRSTASRTLHQFTQLLHVLELPQLAATCARAGQLHEALQLVAHVHDICRRHTHVPIIKRIVDEVDGTYRSIHQQLLNQLKGALQLSRCIDVVGYLRRMDLYSECELRLLFLQSRDCWFLQQLAGITCEDPCGHMLRTVELSRWCLFDIITQYRSVFSDCLSLDQEAVTASSTSPSDAQAAAVVNEWISLKVERFLCSLSDSLRRWSEQSDEVPDKLDSLVSQCMYFGQSAGRLGADFRALLVPLFHDAVVRRSQLRLSSAVRRFCQQITPLVLTQCVMSPSQHHHEQHRHTDQDNSDQEDMLAPYSLMQCLPLARMCNAVLSVLNTVRLCPALSLLSPVKQLISDALSQAVSHLVHLHDSESEGWSQHEMTAFCRVCCCMSQVLVPYLSKCVGARFQAESVSAAAGISLVNVHHSGLCCLNVAGIVAPLADFIDSQTGQQHKTHSDQPQDARGDNDAADTKLDESGAVSTSSVKSQQDIAPTGSVEQCNAADSSENNDNVTTLSCGDESAARCDENDATVACEDNNDAVVTTGDNNDAVITTGDNNDAVVTTGDNNDAVVTTAHHNDAVITTGDNNDADVTTGDNNDAVVTTEDNNDAVVTTGDNTDAVVTTGDNNDAVITTGDNNDAVGTTGDNTDAVVTTGDNNDAVTKH